jgi:hypothetical protein
MKVCTKSLLGAAVCTARGAATPGSALAVDPGVNQPGRAGNRLGVRRQGSKQ